MAAPLKLKTVSRPPGHTRKEHCRGPIVLVRAMSRVKYYIPEDGDEFEHPNLFSLRKDKGVTLRDLRESFPVPGVYHFRILRSIGQTKVWMDAMDETEEIPVHDKCIFSKVSRIRYPDEASCPPVRPAVSASSAAASASSSSSSQPPAEAPAQAVPVDAENLVDFADFDDAPVTTPAAAVVPPPALRKAVSLSPPLTAQSSLGSTTSQSGSEGDLLGFDMASSTPAAAPVAPAPAPAPASGSTGDLFGLGDLQAPNLNAMAPINAMGGGMPMGAPMGGAPIGAPLGVGGMTPSPMMGAMGGGNNNQNRAQQQQQQQQQPMGFGKKDAFSDLWKK